MAHHAHAEVCFSNLFSAAVLFRLPRIASLCSNAVMHYKIELRYLCGWDDAGWTEEIRGETNPMRFENVEQGQAALDEFFAGVKAAVASGDMDTEEVSEDYRIVGAK